MRHSPTAGPSLPLTLRCRPEVKWAPPRCPSFRRSRRGVVGDSLDALGPHTAPWNTSASVISSRGGVPAAGGRQDLEAQQQPSVS
ncbi:hypothetical protein NDU88_001767 [Pleurodeles waltl]|uniref:Uncharacterized protein n=1 Tax=Pleurodeles waltl TaxID=8319 RepID=A0AAV7M230_PLEWA|nr:hypothetical protein NDU88_001767 [Pleurodeles waltl]